MLAIIRTFFNTGLTKRSCTIRTSSSCSCESVSTSPTGGEVKGQKNPKKGLKFETSLIDPARRTSHTQLRFENKSAI
jgi:hypothetical protein